MVKEVTISEVFADEDVKGAVFTVWDEARGWAQISIKWDGDMIVIDSDNIARETVKEVLSFAVDHAAFINVSE